MALPHAVGDFVEDVVTAPDDDGAPIDATPYLDRIPLSRPIFGS